MSRRLATTALAAAVTLALLSAGRVGAVQRDRDNILAQLRQIQAQLSQLQSSHAALKQAIDGLTARAEAEESYVRKALADSKVVLGRLEQDVSVLSARLDETNDRLGSLQQELMAMRQSQQPLVLPPQTAEGGEGEGEGTEPGTEETTSPPPVVAAGPSVADIYNQARIDYTQGRYGLAISGFRDVAETDPRGDLADNAHYWIGECYFAQRQYDRAIEAFDTVIRDYPESNKLSDAYLKKAMSLENLGRRSEAMHMYELVIEQFPRTQHERLARARLEALMRTTPPPELR